MTLSPHAVRTWSGAAAEPAVSRRAGLVLLLAVALLPGGPARALEPAKGKVVLTVTGLIDQTNASGKAEFDMDMLAALPQRSFSTMTPWYKQPRKFTGPLLRDVLAAVGAKGMQLKAVAINDYKVDIPVEDSRQFDMVLARLMDDAPMPVRDKGPLFIVYPYDSLSELKSERYYMRSAWQLKALEVR
ncbi:MAG: hypothetical protein RL722_292 [Pseudomonadota bacterium]|jgi:hypothetical protein